MGEFYAAPHDMIGKPVTASGTAGQCCQTGDAGACLEEERGDHHSKPCGAVA